MLSCNYNRRLRHGKQHDGENQGAFQTVHVDLPLRLLTGNPLILWQIDSSLKPR